MLEVKFPIEYEIEPVDVDKGVNWLTLKIKNVGVETLKRLDIHLHSRDTFFLSVAGEGHFISELGPDQQVEVYHRVFVSGPSEVYVTIDARKDGKHFWWDSGHIDIYVSEQKAKLESFFVLSSPYTSTGKTIEIEATIKGLQKSTGLNLEFWVDSPSRKYEELAKIVTGELDVGQEAKYIAEVAPKEKGYYTVYANLYDGWRRIDQKTDNIYVMS